MENVWFQSLQQIKKCNILAVWVQKVQYLRADLGTIEKVQKNP
jgi:hypothetical protein